MKDFFPKVSIIIPVENIEEATYQSINSVLSQTYQNLEIIVISREENLSTLKNKYEEKCMYQSISSFDMVKALNVGLKKKTGEYVTFLFNNDIYGPNTIEKELLLFSSSNNIDFVFSSDLEDVKDKLNNKIQNNEFDNLILLTGIIPLSGIMFRKELLNKGFDEKYKTTFIERKVEEISSKSSFAVIDNQLVKENAPTYKEAELIDLWKDVLKKTNEKEIVNAYETKTNFYKEGIKVFNKYGFIFPKELHDYVIKNKFNPLISVVIPVYNGSNYIKEAIQSVLNQTYTNYELIIVEDGSTDNGLTKKCVLEFDDKLTYYWKENGGVGSALNLGIEKAKGKYISWLSHDDAYYPYKLQMQVDALNELKNKDTIIFSNFQLMDENSVVFTNTNFDQRYPIKQLENKIFPVFHGTTNGCAMLIPKVAFETCGGFDVSQRTTNDYIMWFNIFREYPSKFLTEHLIKYRIHKKQDSQSSPIYIPESEEMWTGAFKKVTKKEIESYGYSELEFFSKFYNEMKLGGLVKTASYLEERYKEIYEKQGPLVSVIMPCYNSEKYLYQAVDSILNQTFAAFELICVDDSSKDNTYTLLKEYEKQDFRIKVVKNKHKKGVSGAMNTGLELARGEYITRMDSDDISYPERLMKQFNFLKSHKEYGTCTVNIDLRENESIIGKGSYKNDKTPAEWKFLWTNPYPNAPSMFRKSLIKNIRFNEDFNVAEDYLFFKELAKYKIYYIDEVHYSYRISQNSLYHTNQLKSIYNSMVIASNYYYEKTKKKYLPEFFYYLTFFSGEETPDKAFNKEEILQFLEETLNIFKKELKWKEEEYKAAKDYAINEIYSTYIEKTVRKESYEAQEYHRMLNSVSWKITKPLRSSMNLLRKGKHFAGRVIKKVIK